MLADSSHSPYPFEHLFVLDAQLYIQIVPGRLQSAASPTGGGGYRCGIGLLIERLGTGRLEREELGRLRAWDERGICCFSWRIL